MPQPIVSILILNWNGEKVLAENITSVLATKYRPIEVIVVDNASTDASLSIIRSFPDVVLITNPENAGYAEGNNIGFDRCHGKYIVTLNNDTVVDSGWLDEPISILERFDRVGIISCRQMNYADRKKIDTLYSFPEPFLLLGRMGHGKAYDDRPLYRKTGYVLGANGASAIYRKRLLSELGGFERKFFAYQEECDLHVRAFYAGWKCIYVPSAVVYHKGSHSFDRVKKIFYYYHERNRIWFIYRNFPLSLILVRLPSIFFREIRTFINMALRRQMVGTYLRARYDGFLGLWQFREIRKRNLSAFAANKVEFQRFMKNKKIPIDGIYLNTESFNSISVSSEK